MEKLEFNVLKAQMEKQEEEIKKVFEKISQRRQTLERESDLESLAYQIHNLYCAVEDLLNIVASAFENRIENKSKYHKELLWRMTVETKGVRPYLINEELYRSLDELRAFRHFFRHGYGADINRKKLDIVLDEVDRVENMLFDQVELFLKKCDSSQGDEQPYDSPE